MFNLKISMQQPVVNDTLYINVVLKYLYKVNIV